MIRSFLISGGNRAGENSRQRNRNTRWWSRAVHTRRRSQTAASSFLSIFRVKNFVAVRSIPRHCLTWRLPPSWASFTRDRRWARSGEATLAEAEELVGFARPVPSTLPTGLEPRPRSVAVKDAFSVTYTPDLRSCEPTWTSIGATNVKLPDELDGATISDADAGERDVAVRREGRDADRSEDGCAFRWRASDSSTSAPPESPTINVTGRGGRGAASIGVSEDTWAPARPGGAAQRGAIWRNTVVVPVVKGTSRDVTVQGEKGLLIAEPDGPGLTLLWQKDGRVYTS